MRISLATTLHVLLISRISFCNSFALSRGRHAWISRGSSNLYAEPGDEKEPVIDSPDRVAPDTHEELLYTLGVNLARQLGDVRPLVEDSSELTQLAKGLLDTVLGRLSEKGQVDLIQRRGSDLDKLVSERAQKLQDRMKVAGLEMLKEMAEADGAVELENGVVLHVLEKADDSASRPTQASTVKIHYHGTLVDGTAFDSTLGDEPVKLPLAGVIPGWRDAVLKMKEGETAMVGIPPDQAYGDKGTPDGRIPGTLSPSRFTVV